MEERDSNGNEARLKAIQSLSDWSKWLISVNFAAATGCVLVLRADPAELVRPMLLGNDLVARFFVTRPSRIDRGSKADKGDRTS